MPPKISRSAMRRRSLQMAQEERAKLRNVPTLEDIAAPVPPLIVMRDFSQTTLRIDVPNLPPELYAECDLQLQISKGGNSLDTLRPPSRSKLMRGSKVRMTHQESSLKWMTCPRCTVSRYNPDALDAGSMDDGSGSSLWSRIVSLKGSANPLEKCVFRVRVRYAKTANEDSREGWSPWSRVSEVQQVVDEGVPPQCGRALCLQRSQTSVMLKWPAPKPDILEYYAELAPVPTYKGIPTFDLEDEIDPADLLDEDEATEIDPVKEIQRRVESLDWTAASHKCLRDPFLCVEHLTPGETYRFRVRARNRAGWGPFGPSSDSFWLAPNPPGSPLQPIVLEMQPRTAILRWNQPRLNGSKAIEGYELAIATNPVGWAAMGYVGQDLPPLLGETDRFGRDLHGTPGTNLDRRAENGDDDIDHRSVGDVSQASYLKEHDPNSNLEWRRMENRMKVDAKRIFQGDTTKYCTHSVLGLAPMTPYKFRIRALCSSGHGGWSPETHLVFTTKEEFDIRELVLQAKRQGAGELIRLMTNDQFLENADLQCRGVRALRLMATSGDTGLKDVMDNGVLEIAIMASLENNRGDPKLLRWTLRLAETLESQIQTHHVETLVRHALDGVQAVSVAQWACSFLHSLVNEHADAKRGGKLCATFPGMLQIPLESARLHGDRAAVYNAALECIYAVARLSKRLRDDLKEREAVRIVKAALAQQSMSQNAARLAGRVLDALKSGEQRKGRNRPGSRGKPNQIKSFVSSSGSVSSAQSSILSPPRSPESHGDGPSLVSDAQSSHLTTSPEKPPPRILGIEAKDEDCIIEHDKVVQDDDEHDDDVDSIATSRRSIGSLKSRLRGEELELFEWIEAELYREQRESGILECDSGPDPRSVRPDNETPAQRQARRHRRHMERHGPDYHELFEELDPGERLIMMSLEKEIRLQREGKSKRRKFGALKSADQQKEKKTRNLLPQHWVWRPKKRFADGSIWKDPTERNLNSRSSSKYSVRSQALPENISGDGGEMDDAISDDEGQSNGRDSNVNDFTVGEIIGRTPEEQLQDFWMSYPGFERHHANLAADGFDDLEALMLATKQDLLDAGMGEKSANVLLRQMKKERPFWKVVFAAQREYNFYLRELGHPIQPLMRYSPTKQELIDGQELVSEYTESEAWYSTEAGSSMAASEIMSEVDEIIALESEERDAGQRLAQLVARQ